MAKTNLTEVTALANQTLAANGYQKLPGGLILQWGSGTFGMAATSGTTGTLTFPIAFPTTCQSIAFTPNFAVQGSSSMFVTAKSSTTASLQRSNNANSDSGTSFFWMAVGY